MRFSLILSTINRKIEVKKFLLSVSNQTFKDFEVIIIDQNQDDSIIFILEQFTNLNIKYIKSKKKGLSLSRNIGIRNSLGEILCFPDDDCEYPPELLYNVNNFFINNDYEILTGKTINKKNNEIVAGKRIYYNTKLNALNILGSSTTLFVKKNNDIVFDERFGLGGRFNSEEENDLIFRLLKKGYKGYYNPDINYVFHPPNDLDYCNLKRVSQRSIGLGAFIAKHLFTKEGVIYFMKYNLIRPLVGSFIYFIKFDLCKSKFYFYKFINIWLGFIKYFKVKK